MRYLLNNHIKEYFEIQWIGKIIIEKKLFNLIKNYMILKNSLINKLNKNI